jgi:HlyD family secretion protein
MRSRKLAAVVVLLAVAVAATVYFLRQPQDRNTLRVSGTIEATDVEVSFQLPGRVIEVVVSEGQAVAAGDLLARLSAEELMERVNQIQASLDAVVSQSKQQETMIELRRGIVENQLAQARGQAEALRIVAERVREGNRPQEIRVAEAELAHADATLAQRRSDFERAAGLFKETILPKQQLDAAETALRTAETSREAASQRLALAREGSRREDIAEAAARVEAAQAGVGVAEAGLRDVAIQQEALLTSRARERELRAQLDAARTQLDYAEIRSPLNGVVLTKNVESGEVVSPGTPVVTVANIDDLWMNVYVPENRTGLVKLGQIVKVSVDSFPGEMFDGKVIFISAESEFTPKTILTEEERIKLVYRVKVSLENSQQRLKPGMPADAEILVQESAGQQAGKKE